MSFYVYVFLFKIGIVVLITLHMALNFELLLNGLDLSQIKIKKSSQIT